MTVDNLIAILQEMKELRPGFGDISIVVADEVPTSLDVIYGEYIEEYTRTLFNRHLNGDNLDPALVFTIKRKALDNKYYPVPL